MNNRKLTLKQSADFCREMFFLISSGMSVENATHLLTQSTGQPTVKRFCEEYYRQLLSGKGVAEALKGVSIRVPTLLEEYMEIAEEGGNLALLLEQAYLLFEEQIKNKNNMLSACIYPIILITFFILAIALMFVLVIPSIEGTYANLGVPLPKGTSMLLAIRAIGIEHGKLLLGLLMLEAGCLYLTRKWWVKCLTIIPLVRNQFYLDFTKNLGLILTAGVRVEYAVSILLKIYHNSIFATELQQLYEAIDGGESFSDAVSNCSFVPAYGVQAMQIGEAAHRLEVCLMQQNQYYQNKVKRQRELLMRLLEPAIVLCMGAGILVMAKSLFLPIIASYQYLMI